MEDDLIWQRLNSLKKKEDLHLGRKSCSDFGSSKRPYVFSSSFFNFRLCKVDRVLGMRLTKVDMHHMAWTPGIRFYLFIIIIK